MTPEPAKPSTLIGERDFAGFFSAAQLAAREHCHFTVSVTLTWSRMGLTDQNEIRAHLQAFIKCMRDWLSQRRLFKAWVFSNESGPVIGLHTHLAVHVPVGHRKAFREWSKAWVARRYGGDVPRAIVTKLAGDEPIVAHWRIVSYCLKGYDRDAVVLGPENAWDGRSVMLGDLIACPWKDPGFVDIERLGWSPWLEKFTRTDRRTPLASRPLDPFPRKSRHLPDMTPPPFRSSYAEGVRDVRLLYPKAFRDTLKY